MAVFTKDFVKQTIIPSLVAELLRESLNKAFLEIDHSKLLSMNALELDGESKDLSYVIRMSQLDEGSEVNDYFNAVIPKPSSRLLGTIAEGDEFCLNNMPLFKVKIIEYKKKTLFKPEIFKAKLVRSEFLDDICQQMEAVARQANESISFGYATGDTTFRTGSFSTMDENHVFSKDELTTFSTNYYLYAKDFPNVISHFIVSLKCTIVDETRKKN